MAYTYATIEAQVRANVKNATAPVTQEIDDAINLLSNFFQNKKIDTSISSVANQSYINKPATAVEIVRVKIGSDDYEEAKISDLSKLEEAENKKWYDWDGKIQLTLAPTSVQSAKIWHKAGFTPLAGSGSTDIPDRLVPVLVTLATWLYFVQMVSATIMSKGEIPDIEPEKLDKICAHWKKSFDELVTSIKTQKV